MLDQRGVKFGCQ